VCRDFVDLGNAAQVAANESAGQESGRPHGRSRMLLEEVVVHCRVEPAAPSFLIEPK
jgi:hypothetical protein